MYHLCSCVAHDMYQKKKRENWWNVSVRTSDYESFSMLSRVSPEDGRCQIFILGKLSYKLTHFIFAQIEVQIFYIIILHFLYSSGGSSRYPCKCYVGPEQILLHGTEWFKGARTPEVQTPPLTPSLN